VGELTLRGCYLGSNVSYNHCCPVKPGSPARNGMILNGVSSI
jgi:hypothetical protein